MILKSHTCINLEENWKFIEIKIRLGAWKHLFKANKPYHDRKENFDLKKNSKSSSMKLVDSNLSHSRFWGLTEISRSIYSVNCCSHRQTALGYKKTLQNSQMTSTLVLEKRLIQCQFGFFDINAPGFILTYHKTHSISSRDCKLSKQKLVIYIFVFPSFDYSHKI